ncbi:glutathione S-transferase family protein [Zhongshania antarctica]|uniref:glutathione S-transferase family protein n=1 Tax=Zhongshania antarctica TaxID=641702 RepID=UPI001D04536D
MTSLENLLNSNGDYLVDESLSLADISVLARIECLAGSSKRPTIINKAPKLAAWMELIENLRGGGTGCSLIQRQSFDEITQRINRAWFEIGSEQKQCSFSPISSRRG